MLNQVTTEALYSATYVENYLDSVDNLPDDVQKHLSRIREIDIQYRAYLREVDNQYEVWSKYGPGDPDTANLTKHSRAMARIKKNLIAAKELGDEKLQIVNQLQELIDQKTRQLDYDFRNLDYGKDDPVNELQTKEIRSNSPILVSPISTTNATQVQPQPAIVPIVASSASLTSERVVPSVNANERTSKRSRRSQKDTFSGLDISLVDVNGTSEASKQIIAHQPAHVGQKKGAGSNKKKKRKTRGTQGGGGGAGNSASNSRDTRDETPPPEETIDPDEPTYCLCDQISFGEMILCDNDLCPIEWFHFSCVSLMSKPKGKWFCPNCRGDRPNVMKPKAQFLKELERYNKEKEEKT